MPILNNASTARLHIVVNNSLGRNLTLSLKKNTSGSFILLFFTRGFSTVNFIEESEALSQSQDDKTSNI